ncbi:MAG: cytochrome b/b6 domain-containing protein [Campylobacterota bacterium]|nr:cytochrome b/b6 domain-containing protein [Campylobacterota bacterium]
MKREIKNQWSLSFRLWHWLHAFVITGLLATVFLRKTFLSWRSNSELIVAKLAEINIDVSTEQAKVIAKAIRAPMWEWHILFGYVLVFLVLWRIALFFSESGKQNYQNLSSESLHKKAVKWGYIAIYTLIAFMAVSGMAIHFYQDLGLLKETAHTIKEIHELTFNAILIFVPLHVIGVFVAENRDEKGIVSAMINGK